MHQMRQMRNFTIADSMLVARTLIAVEATTRGESLEMVIVRSSALIMRPGIFLMACDRKAMQRANGE